MPFRQGALVAPGGIHGEFTELLRSPGDSIARGGKATESQLRLAVRGLDAALYPESGAHHTEVEDVVAD